MEIEEGTTNVYADLGRPDADEMLIKAQLATKIGEIIKRRRLTQIEAAEIIGMPQPSCRACRVVSSGVPARRRCSIA
ncbi:MAG TPA: XRE family transcriptional regulator [Acetobacteraceae bacterium]|nr:XRE family transcriptional regulator [Acetobacteraceae bacterium]